MGTEFPVHLPLARDQAMPMAAQVTAAEKRARSGRLRILVVDDSEDSALTLATLLELSGYEMHVAHDGEQALAVAEASRPDVVLLDIGLPKMSGNEVCRRFRQEEWGRQMTVIALTGWGQEQDRGAPRSQALTTIWSARRSGRTAPVIGGDQRLASARGSGEPTVASGGEQKNRLGDFCRMAAAARPKNKVSPDRGVTPITIRS